MLYHVNLNDFSDSSIHCYRKHDDIDENTCFERIWNTKCNTELKICGDFCKYGNYLKLSSPYGRRIENTSINSPSVTENKINLQGVSVDLSNKLPGERLRIIRLSEKITQKDLAAKLGLCYTSISNWENGFRPLPKKWIPQLIEILGLSDNFFD